MCVQNSETVRTKMVEEFGDVSLALLTRFRKAGQEAFVPLGITAAEAMLLIFVERGHEQPAELTKLMGIVFPAVSAMTAKLVEAGLIVKESHENDGRRVLIKLTGLGQDACQQIKAVWAEHSPINTAGYSDDELRAFIKFGRSVLPASSSGN